MRHAVIPALLLALAAAAAPAAGSEPAADLTVRFQEGTGSDLFTVENTSTCLATVMRVIIDLKGSVGGLVFDTLPGGGGINMSRPFLLVEGADKVTATEGGGDGARSLSLILTGLRMGEVVRFAIDVDDMMQNGPWGQTQVAGPEFEGASVTAVLRRPDGAEWTDRALFGPDGRAYVNLRNCAMS